MAERTEGLVGSEETFCSFSNSILFSFFHLRRKGRAKATEQGAMKKLLERVFVTCVLPGQKLISTENNTVQLRKVSFVYV